MASKAERIERRCHVAQTPAGAADSMTSLRVISALELRLLKCDTLRDDYEGIES